jgi:hypothetical protein
MEFRNQVRILIFIAVSVFLLEFCRFIAMGL